MRVTDIVPYLLPPPSAVWTAFLEVREILPGHIATTMTEAVLGLVLGAVAGAAVAALLWAIPFVRRTLLPSNSEPNGPNGRSRTAAHPVVRT